MVRHFIDQPLPSSFMILSIAGFVFSALIVWPLNMTWGFTFTILFALWFIAAVYNFTHAWGDEHLDIHSSEALLKKSPMKKKALPKAGKAPSAGMSRALAVILAFVGGGLSMLFTHGEHERGLLLGYLVLLVMAAIGRSIILMPGGADFYSLMVMLLILSHAGFMVYQALRSDVAFTA